MCGICGFTWSGEERREGIRKSLFLRKEQRPAALEAMMDAVYHRGPDEGRMYLDAQAALGFRRLRILDLEGSMQPMKNETGDKVLVFNGEIYNYRELREELEALLHDIDIVAEGGASFRFLSGRYGSGKSFLLQTIRNYAMDRNFVVADADLSPERRLQGTRGQGLA